MEFFQAVQRRQSIRKFRRKAPGDRLLVRILEAANRAPSAGNLQAYRVYVVEDPVIRRRLDAASGSQGVVEQAPVVMVFCALPRRSAVKYGARGEQLFCIQDATIACAYAQLAATALGLASVWIGAVHEPETVKEALRLEEGLWPIAFLPIGYAAERPASRPRRPLAEMIYEVG